MLIHVVGRGEVLWQIAELYETDINTVMEFNEITNPNLLLEGEALLIPSPGVLYTVRQGETLWEISQRLNVPLEALMSLNNIINPNLIYPGVVLTIPQEPSPPIEVNAYTYVYGGVSDIPILSTVIDHLTYLTPITYLVRADGRLTIINDIPAIQYTLANNVIPIMSVSNFIFIDSGEEIAQTILNDVEIMQRLVENIIFVMDQKGYRGVNINFENIYPEDREAYNNFLQTAVGRLHAEGYFVSSVIAPRYSDDGGEFTFTHDVEALGMILEYPFRQNWLLLRDNFIIVKE